MAFRKIRTGRRWKLSPTKIIALGFAGIILLGTALLCLPIASRDGQSCAFLPAMFTATSATCVTGLVIFDTWTQWSGFGQIVILTMIEIGGLGFMTAASMVVFMLRRKVGLKQRLIIAQALSVEDMDSVVKLQKMVLFGSLSVQGLGALILFLRFLPEFGAGQAAVWGIFHAVSAFCNAGFDIFGKLAPGQSLVVFNSDPIVCITLMLLVVIGGLGFFVWEELVRLRRFRKFSVYTKLVLLATVFLILFGAAGFLALEWNNPNTMGNMTVWQKVLNSFFQSVSMRTAGFASVDQAQLTQGSKVLSIFLMLIGGASGSTAGGMKIVTGVVLVLIVITRARGRQTVNVFRKRVLPEKVMDAMTIVSIVVGLSLAGALLICGTSGISFLDSWFETASALATVGVTAGVTASLSIPAQLMIIVFMYFGRVGVLTISLGFMMGNQAEDRFQYAHTNLLIG